MVNVGGNFLLAEFLLHLEQFLKIAVLAELCDYVAIIRAVQYIEAFYNIIMIQLFEDGDLLLQQR